MSKFSEKILRSALCFLGLSVLGTVFGSVTSAASRETPYRVGPISSALGGAGRAVADPTEAGGLNPAALVYTPSYHFAISRQESHRDQGDGYHDFGIMLADGGQDKVAAGSFSYVQRSTLRGGPGAISAEQKDFQASAAFFLPKSLRFLRSASSGQMSLGLTYRRLIHQQPGADFTQDTYSVGAVLPLGSRFGIAVVGHDLAGSSAAAPVEAQFAPAVAVGFRAVPVPMFQARLDVVRELRDNPDARSDVRGGIESWFREEFAFRLGGAWLERRDEMWLTTGIGFKGPRLSFGYAFEKELRTADGTRHTFDLWMPL